MIARAEIVAEARRWLGTPWQHQAAARGVATDCIGFVAGVARAVGIPEAGAFFALPQFRCYGREPDPSMLLDGCRLFLEPTALARIQPADVLVMRFKREPQHFGLVTAVWPAPYLIHAYAQAGKVVEHRLDARWERRILGAYRFRGLA